MKKGFGLVLVCVVFAMLQDASISQANDLKGTTVIVLPARYRAVQVAFDIQELTPAVLVSYQKAPGAEPAMHAWDGQAWRGLRYSDYSSAAFLRAMPARVIMLGDNASLPDGLLDDTLWGPSVFRIENLRLAEMITGYASILDFKGSDVLWLARRYNLEIEDVNADRRRYGRYGPPGYTGTQRQDRGDYIAPTEPMTMEATAERDALSPVEIEAPAVEAPTTPSTPPPPSVKPVSPPPSKQPARTGTVVPGAIKAGAAPERKTPMQEMEIEVEMEPAFEIHPEDK